MSDAELRFDVIEELSWEPRIDGEAIAVTVDDGVVTLRGTVGRLREKSEAKSAVQRVRGVNQVANQLQVRVPRRAARDDVDLRAAVLQALMLDSLVPSTVDAQVVGGVVTLTGTAERQYQREEADFVVSNVLGVARIDDAVVLVPPEPIREDLERAIEKAFERDARLEAARLYVDRSHGAIVITGVVRSWAEHDAALASVWAAPGVTRVDDRLRVRH